MDSRALFDGKQITGDWARAEIQEEVLKVLEEIRKEVTGKKKPPPVTPKTPKEREAEKQRDQQTKSTKEYLQALKPSVEYRRKLNATVKSSISTFSRMDATSRSVTESFLGVVGGAGAVGSVLGLLASVTDEYIKSLKGSIQAGFSFSDQIIQTNHELASIGINFHQFGQILVEQGEAIRFLGSNSHEASSRFVDLVKTVRMSTKDMGYFGLSSREMADELADTMGVLITAGVSEADIMSRTHETFTYLNQEVLAYARLTGRNRRDIMRSKQELVDDNVLFKEVLKKLGPEAMQTFDMVGASMSAFGKQSVFAGDVLQKFITQIVDGVPE